MGIPGRVVVADVRDTNNARRKAMAKKIGFDAYGQTPDMPDPVANAVDCMLDHMHSVDERLEQICAALKKSGMDISVLELPELPIDHLKDD